MPRSFFLLRAFPLLAAGALVLGGCSEPTARVADPADREHLLDRHEILTPEDPNAPEENEAWVRWIRRNEQPVRSLTSTNFDDLRFLEGVLAGKTIVQLGESSHGVREFNQAKTRLIRYLHEEQGFDVIAFESGLFECWRANQAARDATPLTTMTSCVFGVWHTEEVLELFAYIRETQSTSRPLVLAGMDTQVSSGPGTVGGAELLRQVVATVDPAYANRVAALEREYQDSVRALRARGVPPGAGYAPLRRLAPAFDSVVAFVDANLAQLTAANGNRAERGLVVRQAAFSRRREIEQYNPPNVIAGHLARERGMADNLDALRQMYPGEKIIVWAHNYHIQHDRAGMRPGDGSDPGDLGDFNTMGHFVAERHRAELYTVGLYMYRGTAANNDRSLYTVTPAASGSLESLGYRVRKKHFFLDVSRAAGPGSEWLDQFSLAKDWGIWDLQQVLREQFDGILFVHSVTPPEYL